MAFAVWSPSLFRPCTALAQTTDFIGKFSSPTTLNNSVLFQSGPQIGLGTTSPLDFMSIRFNNNNGGQTGLALQNTDGAGYSGALMYDHLGQLGVFQGFNNFTKEYRINNIAPGGTIAFRQGANVPFFVNSAGNVGIGTIAPGFNLKLDVVGNGIFRGTDRSIYVNGVTISGENGLRIHNSGGSSYIDHKGPGGLNFRVDNALGGANRMYIDGTTGNVGIGTNPTRGKLQIQGGSVTPSDFLGAETRIYRNDGVGNYGCGICPAPPPTFFPSLYATDDIVGQIFVAFSDARIKHIDGRSDATRDLATLAGIEITDYGYVDTVAKGTRKHKKVIAQQIETVFPQAVQRSTDVVPDIYKMATARDGWISLATDLKAGDRVRLIGNKSADIHNVLEVADGKFRTDFKADGEQVFVYGREVNDFRGVDYDAIAMLNVSATQELHRRLEKEMSINAEQAARIAELEHERATHAARLTALEKQMQAAAVTPVRPEPARFATGR